MEHEDNWQDDTKYDSRITYELPMTFHKVYLVLLILFLLDSIFSFSLGTFISAPIYITLFYGLYNKKTWAPTLVKVYSIYSIIIGVIAIFGGFILGHQVDLLTGDSGNLMIFGIITTLIRLFDIIISICIWIYYEKRRHLFKF